jgi:hypothetical protein
MKAVDRLPGTIREPAHGATLRKPQVASCAQRRPRLVRDGEFQSTVDDVGIRVERIGHARLMEYEVGKPAGVNDEVLAKRSMQPGSLPKVVAEKDTSVTLGK